jgi:hypothetical protein
MKTLNATLLIILAIAPSGCRRPPQEPPQGTKRQMLLDSDVSGKNVAMVRPNDAARPTEPFVEVKELSTIMQHDIDVAERAPSKDIVYVKSGEAARPAESRR